MTIFRGTDPHIYRANIYAYRSTCCDDWGETIFFNRLQVALEFRMNWDNEGRLTTGSARILPECRGGQDLDCTPHFGSMGLFIVPPVFPGNGDQPPSVFRNVPYLTRRSADASQNVLSATINWADILKDTALNTP
jgi:hypothetical protein